MIRCQRSKCQTAHCKLSVSPTRCRRTGSALTKSTSASRLDYRKSDIGCFEKVSLTGSGKWSLVPLKSNISQFGVVSQASRGPLTDDSLSKVEECCELQGTGALILLLPALFTVDPGDDKQDVPLLSALVQLKQLQQVSAWNCQLPLVILVPGSDDGDTQKLEEGTVKVRNPLCLVSQGIGL